MSRSQTPGMESASLVFTQIEPEDQARADLYALLSRLYGAAPDAALLAAITSANELAAGRHQDGSSLHAAWQAVVAASAQADPEDAAAEYQELFVGVGQSEVSLHGSSYVKAPSGKQLLVGIREALSELGLARQAGTSLYEDHLAAVCETMRVLITGAGGAPFDIEQQCIFFTNNIGSWVFACCAAITSKSIANYYRRVAQLTESFMALERDSLAIE